MATFIHAFGLQMKETHELFGKVTKINKICFLRNVVIEWLTLVNLWVGLHLFTFIW
jgi:hypothetical protein